MVKSRQNKRSETLAKKTKSEGTGKKPSRIEKLDHDACRRQIIDVLRLREGLDIQIYRTIIRREKMSQLDDSTELILRCYKHVLDRLNALDPELFLEGFEEARQALIREVTKKQEDVLEVKQEIKWTTRMLVNTESILRIEKRRYEPFYSCLSETPAGIAQSREDVVFNWYRLEGKRKNVIKKRK